MALMSTLKVIPNWADPNVTLPPSWQFVNLCWQSVFVFLPLMVAYNAAKKLEADPWVGFAIMAVVMLPGFAGLKEFSHPQNVFGSEVDIVNIFGLPLTIHNYSSQVFPPLLMAAVLGPLYKFLKRIIPANVQLIFVPFLSMLIMIPLTAFLIGPIGVYAGAGLGSFLKSVNDFSPLIFAVVIPLAYPFMVPLGLHWPINAIMLINIQTLGYDFIQGPMGPGTSPASAPPPACSSWPGASATRRCVRPQSERWRQACWVASPNPRCTASISDSNASIHECWWAASSAASSSASAAA